MAGKKSAKALAIVLVILIAVGLIAGLLLYKKYKGITNDPQSSFTGETSGTLLLEGDAAADENAADKADVVEYNGQSYQYNEDIVNIMLLGIDSDAWRETEHMGWRSDMMMLCSIDFSDNSVTMTSIPRDTRTTVCHIDTDTGKITSTNTDKINSAYAYGNGPNHYGPQNAMKAASDFLSCDGQFYVPIDYYISIDLEGVPKFATALDGIDVTLDVFFPNLGNKGETITLEEDSARMYLENRKDVGGELVRVSHEQQFLLAVMKKIQQQGAVNAAPKLYTQLLEFMHTNLSLEQILAAAKVLDSTGTDAVTFQTIGGDFDYIDNVSYFIANMDDVAQKVINVMYVPAA